MSEEYKKNLDLGIENIHKNNFKEAINLISQSIKEKNDWEISYFYRAVCNQALENFDEAILDYTKAIQINPNMTDAYYNRAKILLEKKDKNINLNQIEMDLKKALKLDENFIDALFAMSALQKKKGNYNEAIQYLDKLLKLEPNAIHARAFKKLLLQKYVK